MILLKSRGLFLRKHGANPLLLQETVLFQNLEIEVEMYKPIVMSLADQDQYEFPMVNFWRRRYPSVEGTLALKNRTTRYALADLVDETELRWQLDHFRELTFTDSEIEYIVDGPHTRDLYRDPEGFKSFLKHYRVPPIDVRREGATFDIRARDKMMYASFCETPTLAIVTNLVGKSLAMKIFGNLDEPRRIRDRNIASDIAKLKEFPGVKYVEFGTRRRYDAETQDAVVESHRTELPRQLIGTSNVLLAMRKNLKPFGTMAHKPIMAFSGIFHGSDDEIRASHMRFFDEWRDEYGSKLAIALNDTYGRSFYDDFGAERAKLWAGYRPDSGDPIEEGEAVIAFLERCGIDPAGQTCFFADGQNVDSMIRCHLHFRGRILHPFGPGTYMTNNVGLPNLSLVMKLVEANGHEVGKLTNNIAKANGSEQVIRDLKRIFGYTSTFSEECRY
jgi:nicotinate phosphoribosyltransferase